MVAEDSLDFGGVCALGESFPCFQTKFFKFGLLLVIDNHF